MLARVLLGGSAAAFGLTANLTGSLAAAVWACVLSLLVGGATAYSLHTARSQPVESGGGPA